MDGNEHDYPVPQNMPQAPLSAPGFGGAQGMPAVPGYASQNPLQPGAMAATAVSPLAANVPVGPSVSAVPSPLAIGTPQVSAGTAPMATMASDDGSVAVDDVVWVNRAKKAIIESQGDPHRQVQLIQHLRSVYLKQRFGRSVHTDGD